MVSAIFHQFSATFNCCVFYFLTRILPDFYPSVNNVLFFFDLLLLFFVCFVQYNHDKKSVCHQFSFYNFKEAPMIKHIK
jgi:hypothetical protein